MELKYWIKYLIALNGNVNSLDNRTVPDLIVLAMLLHPSINKSSYSAENHYSDVVMSAMGQITGVSIVCSAACLGTDKKK